MCSHWFEEARLKWLNRIQLIKVETIRQRVPELLLGADPLDSLLECYSAGAQEKTEENLRSHVTTHEQSLTQLPQESNTRKRQLLSADWTCDRSISEQLTLSRLNNKNSLITTV